MQSSSIFLVFDFGEHFNYESLTKIILIYLFIWKELNQFNNLDLNTKGNL